MANKRWTTDGKKHELLFTKYYDEECVLVFCVDKDDPTCFWYVSEELKVEDNCVFADSIEEAKEMFEEMYADHIREEIDHYENILRKWEEE